MEPDAPAPSVDPAERPQPGGPPLAPEQFGQGSIDIVAAFRASFDQAPVPMVIATVDGDVLRLARINEACCELMGHDPLELLAAPLERCFHPADRPALAAALAEWQRGEPRIGSLEVQLLKADGAVVPAWIHGRVLDGEFGRSTTVIVHVVDLTDRHRAETRVEDSRQWMAALAEIRAAVLADQPLGDILAVICERARHLTGGDTAFVTSPDPTGERHAVEAVDRPSTSALLPDSFVVDEIASRALAGSTGVIDDLDTDDLVDPHNRDAVRARRHPGAAALVSPIATGRGTALLFVTSDTPGAFDDDAVTLIEALAAEAATALRLHEARRREAELVLLEDRERLARELRALVIHRLFGAGMRLQSLLPLIADTTAAERVEDVVSDLDRAIDDLRSTIFELANAAEEH